MFADPHPLTLKQRHFCQLYASAELGNGIRAYAAAYGLNLADQGQYRTAKSNASRLLTNANVKAYIVRLLQQQGLDDTVVDKQHAFLINQHADFHVKLAAIRLYNEMTGRIRKNTPTRQITENHGNVDLAALLRKRIGEGEAECSHA